MAEESSYMSIKIRNATKDQWPIVADMIRSNFGIIDRTGIAHGVGLQRGDIYAYVYITKSGQTVVAYVENAKPI